MSKKKVREQRNSQARPPAPKEPKTSPKQKLALLGFGLLIFVVLLGLAELVLAITGIRAPDRYADPFVGFEPGHNLFEAQTGENGEHWMMTREPKLRFFNQQRFQNPKPENRFRIFTLGGSTTYGRPYDHRVSFSHWMELLLNAPTTSKRYEVINAGGISYASYRVVVLMKELVGYQPDLFVVYSGHNEFLEERTYRDMLQENALLRFTKQQLSRLRSFNLLRQKVSRSRGEVDSSGNRLQTEVKAKLDVWAGLEAFRRDDSWKASVLAHYRFNLQQMVAIARDHGIPIIFVKPASNLKDFSPFKSENTPGMTADQRRSFARAYQRGRSLLEANNPAGALPFLIEAAGLNPQHADALYRLGSCHLDLDQFQEAGDFLREAREMDICPLRAIQGIEEALTAVTSESGDPLIDLPRFLAADCRARQGHDLPGNQYFLDHVHPSIEVHQQLAELLIAAMDIPGRAPLPEAAKRRVFEEVLADLAPADLARRDLNLGKVLFWSGKIEEAGEVLRRALHAVPDYPMAHQSLANVYQKQGHPEKSIPHYLAVVRAIPDFFDAHYNLGKSYQALRQYEAATASFRRALEIKPKDGKSHFSLAGCLVELRRFEEALARVDLLTRVEPGFEKAWVLRGSIYERQGKLDQAFAAYQKNLAEHPDDPTAHNEVGVIYALKGRPESALQAFTRATELDSGFADAYRNMALAHQASGNTAAAGKALLRVAALKPDDYRAHFELGGYFESQGQFQEAVASYRECSRLNPGFAQGFFSLGRALTRTGSLNDAGPALKRALAINPKHGPSHYLLGSLSLQQRRWDEAAAHFEAARKLGIEIPPEIMQKLKTHSN